MPTLIQNIKLDNISQVRLFKLWCIISVVGSVLSLYSAQPAGTPVDAASQHPRPLFRCIFTKNSSCFCIRPELENQNQTFGERSANGRALELLPVSSARLWPCCLFTALTLHHSCVFKTAKSRLLLPFGTESVRYCLMQLWRTWGLLAGRHHPEIHTMIDFFFSLLLLENAAWTNQRIYCSQSITPTLAHFRWRSRFQCNHEDVCNYVCKKLSGVLETWEFKNKSQDIMAHRGN